MRAMVIGGKSNDIVVVPNHALKILYDIDITLYDSTYMGPVEWSTRWLGEYPPFRISPVNASLS
jgi:hypothetical protein